MMQTPDCLFAVCVGETTADMAQGCIESALYAKLDPYRLVKSIAQFT